MRASVVGSGRLDSARIGAVLCAAVFAAGSGSTAAVSTTPANCNGVIAVAATTRTGTKATLRNYGSAVAIAAPGVSLWSTLNSGTDSPATPTHAQ